MNFFGSLFLFSRKLGAHEFGLFTIGGIIALITDHSIIFSGLSNSNELLRSFTTDCPAISMYDNKTQAATGEDGSIGISHLAITDIHSFGIRVKTVEIFHDKLAHAKEAR